MKWKKKGGCLRAEDAGVVFKIEETTLSLRNPSGGWETCEENASVEGAKERAEKLADIYRQLAEIDAKQLEARRARAAKLAARSPEEKAVENLFEMWQRFSNMERFAARKLKPSMCYLFDIFDKTLEDMQRVRDTADKVTAPQEATP